MEGDVVKILSSATEKDGFPSYCTDVSEKPMYMLTEEYNETLINCAIRAVISACENVYPLSKKAQEDCAKGIMSIVLKILSPTN